MEGPAGGDRAKRMKTRNFYKITKRNETWPVGQWRMANGERRATNGEFRPDRQSCRCPCPCWLCSSSRPAARPNNFQSFPRLSSPGWCSLFAGSQQPGKLSHFGGRIFKISSRIFETLPMLDNKTSLDTIYFRKLKLKGLRKNIHWSLRVRTLFIELTGSALGQLKNWLIDR